MGLEDSAWWVMLTIYIEFGTGYIAKYVGFMFKVQEVQGSEFSVRLYNLGFRVLRWEKTRGGRKVFPTAKAFARGRQGL